MILQCQEIRLKSPDTLSCINRVGVWGCESCDMCIHCTILSYICYNGVVLIHPFILVYKLTLYQPMMYICVMNDNTEINVVITGLIYFFLYRLVRSNMRYIVKWDPHFKCAKYVPKMTKTSN